MANETITSNYQELRDGGQSVLRGLNHLNSVFHGVKTAARAGAEASDPADALEHIAMLADLGAEHASLHINRLCDLNDIIDDLDRPQIDMTASALQAGSIHQALAALAQVIPEDQADILGAIKTIIKQAHDLSSHLITGGSYRLVLKEALDEAKQAA